MVITKKALKYEYEGCTPEERTANNQAVEDSADGAGKLYGGGCGYAVGSHDVMMDSVRALKSLQ